MTRHKMLGTRSTRPRVLLLILIGFALLSSLVLIVLLLFFVVFKDTKFKREDITGGADIIGLKDLNLGMKRTDAEKICGKEGFVDRPHDPKNPDRCTNYENDATTYVALWFTAKMQLWHISVGLCRKETDTSVEEKYRRTCPPEQKIRKELEEKYGEPSDSYESMVSGHVVVHTTTVWSFEKTQVILHGSDTKAGSITYSTIHRYW